MTQQGYLTTPYYGGAGYFTDNKLTSTLSEFFAIGLVAPKFDIRVGGSYTFQGASSATVLTENNIISALKDANKKGLAYFIAESKIMPQTPTNKQEGIVLADRSMALNTIIVDCMWDAKLRHSENGEFSNFLRRNPNLDVFLFTNTGFIHIKHEETPIVFSEVGKVPGAEGSTTAGTLGFKFGIRSMRGKGEPILVQSDELGANTGASFDLVAGTVVGATKADKGEMFAIKRSASGAITVPITVTGGYETNFIIDDFMNGTAVNTNITFDALTNTLTLASGIPVGTYYARVTASNEKGVKGDIKFQFTV